MTDTDLAALSLAVAANIAGVALLVLMWRRRLLQERALRSAHPVTRPSVRVDLVEPGPTARLRVSVLAGAPEITVDILSARDHAEGAEWRAATIDEPIVIASGSSAVIPVDLGASAGGHTVLDVVLAWTTTTPGRSTSTSQLFRLPPERDEPTAGRATAGLTGRTAAVLAALLIGSSALVTLAFIGGTGSDDPATDTPPDSTEGAAIASSTSAAPPPTSSLPATTSTTASTSGPTTTTTPSSTTTTPTSTTSTSVAEPVVTAFGRIEPCRFGSNCLVVGFTVTGFDPLPGTYVCEFDDGSRYDFTFDSPTVETACSTASADATVTVEVAGVRSAPVTRP